ncbi:TBC1 domain family member 22B-like isoform X2 [Hydractinia symbiolongicarpus]|uniref:TBC1 domain family member 22B-like isoform X2 n=1 Tax=Hydractinia symbiolongicarpus TaxID=13093 RepID=UPI002549D59A|nr:TBC1 domain family member 22B-like isoform X2 [Hydractinia symbiolongicarpus]
MSEVAKDRLLAIGTRFASYEHQNATKLSEVDSKYRDQAAQNTQTAKMSFWKKNSGKVPGSAHLATYIKGSRNNRQKSGTSFQEFEGSTLDAWDEDEDEPLKVLEAVSSSPPNDTTSGLEVRQKIGKDDINRPSMDRLSSTEEINRHPQPAPGEKLEGKTSKAASLKNAMVNKLSEKLAKVNRSKPSSPTIPNEPEDFLAPPLPHSPIRQVPADFQDQENARLEKFGKLLSGPTTDLDQLRKLSWNGIPKELRGTAWRLLSGYLPPSIDRRQATLERKQTEYHNFVQQYYPTRHDPLHQETYRQIHIDIPRTNPLIPIFQQEVVQELFERILYIWAIRHPASGYVQGINDLVVPFFVVFLSEHVDKEVETYNINNVSKDKLDMVEADTYWCVSKLLDGIQDNYTFAQPGIQTKVNTLKNLISRIDDPLNQHILSHGIDYLQFTFRWMNNLLMRELPLRASIRLWDTYWSEPDGFAMFHLYVCAALLTLFSKEIMSKVEFQSLMVFLQNLPCKDWQDDDISCLLAEAYRLKFVFADAPKHLGKK